MKYNKRKLNKVNDKKIMKKVKKNWIVVSLGFFTLLGTGLYFEYNQTTASADSISNVQSKSTSDAKLNENDEKISPNPNNSINTINEKGVSVKQEYSDYTRYIDYQEAYSNLSTSGKTLADQRIDSVHYVRTKVFDSSNNLIGYSSDGSNNADISLNDSQNGWRPKSNTSSILPEISSPSISGYGDPSISEVKSSFIPGQGFTDSGNPDVTISDGDTGQRNAIEHVKVFYTNPLSQYSVKTQYANLTRQIDYVEDSNQATSGTHIYPTRYDHIGWVRNIVQDKDGNVLGYSTTNSTNINISKSDSNNGWRLLDNSPSSIPDASSPNDSTLTEKGYSGPDVSVVSSTYSPDQGFSNPSNLSNVAIFDGKDSNGNVIEKNAYELVTVKYKNMRTSQNDYSNLTRQIDYVNRNDFVDDGNPIPAGYHIYPSRKDTVKYIRTRVYDTNGNLIGYSSTGSSNNVDIPLDDLSQGWHLAQDSPQNEIPTAYSPTVDGYTNPSYSSFTSEYAPGDGFNNKYGKPNVVINGVPANTYEYVKVVYGRDSNVVKIDTKTLTRTVKYVDKSGKEIVAPTIDNVTYKRAEVYSPDGSTLLGYSSNLDNSKTPDISTSDPNQGWIQQTNDLKSYNVQDLSKYGYSNPNTEYITSSYSGKDGFSYSNNYKNSKIYNDNNNEDITVTYSHKVDTVTPDQPGEPGQPINPDNPDGPKWPNGTDKDSLSKSVNQTINYVDGNGKSVHDASHDQVTFSRTARVDEVTGEVTYGNWDKVSSTFSAKGSPVVSGYVLRDEGQKTIPASTVTPNSSDENETVVYDKVGSLVPVDTAGNPIDNGSHNTSYPNDNQDAGKITNPVIPSIPGKTPVDKDGNPLTSGNTYPVNGVKFNSDDKEQDFTVTLAHKVDTVTPDQPGEPGQPINPDNPDGPKWSNGTDKDSLSKSVNQTINYVDGNGKSVHDASHDQVTFSRTAQVDEVTGEVTYGNWSSTESRWSKAVSPSITGYKLTNSNEKIVEATEVNENSEDEVINIQYKKVTPTSEINNPTPSNKQNGRKEHGKLPQTGEADESKVELSGLALLLISLTLGIFGIKKRKK